MRIHRDTEREHSCTAFSASDSVHDAHACMHTQGYIQDPEDMFKVPMLARLSAPGAVFDPLRSAKGGVLNFLMPLVPVLVHVATIFVLNQIIYRNVAGACTPQPLRSMTPYGGAEARPHRGEALSPIWLFCMLNEFSASCIVPHRVNDRHLTVQIT
jgi:hypothetical protein